MKGRLVAAFLILATVGACSRADYVPDGALAKPLTSFDRIDVRALQNKTSPKTGDAAQASPDKFIEFFRKDLTARLHRRKAFNLASGPMLVVDGSVLKYECESRTPSNPKDTMTNKATVEIEIMLSDQSGARLGGGKCIIEYLGSTQDGALNGAEVRVSRAIAAYLRKPGKGEKDEDP